MKENKQQIIGIRICYYYFFIFGLTAMGFTPALGKNFQDTFGFTNSDLGLLYAAASVVAVLASLAGGALTDKIGALKTMIIACPAIALTALLFWPKAGAAFFVVTFLLFNSAAMLTVAINVLGASLFGTRQTERMAGMHGFQGLGRIIGPLVVGIVLGAGYRWQSVFLITAAVHLLYTFVFLYLGKLNVVPKLNPSKEKLPAVGLLKERAVLSGISSFFFCAAVESLYVYWTPVFLEKEALLPKDQSMLTLSMMMAGLSIARIAPLMLKPLKPFKALLYSVLLQLIATVILVSTNDLIMLAITGIMLGVSFGLYWPAALSRVYAITPQNRHGAIAGLAVTFSALGNMSFHTLFGYGAEAYSIGFTLTVIPLLSVFFAMLFLGCRKSSEQEIN
ncbi:MAG: MFS transporter [Candidatus Dadabacteria bacterium]|nr:MAG: MFS transporter [Candidatus Dadabacteria bacterium]